jgi:hypothetical protein
MKKFVMIVVALLYSFICVNMVFATADTWTQKADVGALERYAAVGFSIGSKGYIGGPNKDLWQYDPVTDIWTQKADILGPEEQLGGAVAFSIGNKGYVGTGQRNSLNYGSKFFAEYDSANNIWTQKPILEDQIEYGQLVFP